MQCTRILSPWASACQLDILAFRPGLWLNASTRLLHCCSSDWPPYANGQGSPLHVVYTDSAQGVALCGRRSVGLLSDGPHNEGNERVDPIDHEHSTLGGWVKAPSNNNREPEFWYLSTI